MTMKKNNQRIVGRGVPTVSTPTPAAMSTRIVPRAPEISTVNGRSIIKAHEQIATVSGSVAFATTKYFVNPGLPIYTWLSGQAAGWEKHHIKKFQIVYVPAEAVTTTAGSIYLAFDYDPMDAAPSNLAALSTYETQANGRVYEKVALDMNCRRAYDGVQSKKIRSGPVGSDLQLYDAATFSFSTISCANTNAIGQLWVYYEIELISQQSEPTVKVNPSLSVFQLGSNQSFTSTVADDIDFDDEIMNGLDLTNTFGVYTVPPGEYLIYGDVEFSGTTVVSLFAELYINGAVVSPRQRLYGMSLSTTDMGGSFHFYHSSTEQFTLSIRATVTSGGSPAAVATYNRLFIKAL